jgi:hypothetical protein
MGRLLDIRKYFKIAAKLKYSHQNNIYVKVKKNIYIYIFVKLLPLASLYNFVPRLVPEHIRIKMYKRIILSDLFINMKIRQ